MSETNKRQKRKDLTPEELDKYKKQKTVELQYKESLQTIHWAWYLIFIIPLIAIIVAFIYWRDILFNYEWEKPKGDDPGFWYYLDDNNDKKSVDLTGDIEKKWNIWMIVINSLMIASSIALIVLIIISEKKANQIICIMYAVMLILWFAVLIWWEGRMVQIIKTMKFGSDTTATFTNKISEAFSNITKKLRKY